MKVLFPLGFLLLFLLGGACTDPITVGSEVLGTDRATVGEVIDLPITARVIREDSFLTFLGNSTSAPVGFSLGQISEPNFGTVRHSVYLTPKLPTAAGNLTVIPSFASQASVDIDSIVILLPIDTLSAFYGPGREFPLSAKQIASRITLASDRYSDFTTTTQSEELAVDMVTTASLTPIEVRDTSINSSTFKRAHLRVRLTDAFVRRFDDIPARAYDTDSTFRERFAGILLSPTGSSDALINLLPVGLQGDMTPQNNRTYAGFNCYYTDSTGTKREYRINFQQALPNYSTDYTGSLVGELVDNNEDSTLIAVAGRGGLITELDFTDLSKIADKVINRAALEVTVASVAGVSYDRYGPPPRLELFYRVPPNNFLGFIEDRSALIGSRNQPPSVDLFLGGNLKTDDGQQFYDPSFTLHLQRMANGEVPSKVYLRVIPSSGQLRLASPARVFLNGPTAANNPARVRVTFTELSQ